MKVTITIEDGTEPGQIHLSCEFGEAVDADSPGTPAIRTAMMIMQYLADQNRETL